MSAALSFEALEDDYLQAHFAWVLELLRAQDTRRLDEVTLARRETTLALLEGYAKRGRFPRNTALLGRLLPVFVDEAGTTCAVAQLMIDTDHRELAERLSAWMNFASVPEMAAAMPHEIGAWAAIAGLTPAEAALIQPVYCEDMGGDYCSGWNLAPGQELGCGGTCKCEHVYNDGAVCCPDVEDGPSDPSACSASEQGVCSAGSCYVPRPPDPCPVGSRDDPCCLDGTMDCETKDGFCNSGTCVEDRSDDACASAGAGADGASGAPLLAALFLLSLRRAGSLPPRLRPG